MNSVCWLFHADQCVVGSISATSVSSGTQHVLATALLNVHLFVTRFGVSVVSVYNKTSFQLLNQISSPTFGTELYGLATSPIHNYLFIAGDTNSQLHRVTLSLNSTNNTGMLSWPVSSPRGLSMTTGGNILVVLYEGTISEYTPDGSLVRRISCNANWHAVEVSHDVWAFTMSNPSMNAICTTFVNGTVIKCSESVAGRVVTQMNDPRALAVDASGYVYVTDRENDRLLMLDPSLTEARQLQLPVNTALMKPLALSIDNSRGQLFVGEDDGQCRVLVFDGIWWRTST